MKHNSIISIAIIGCFMLLAASCEKEIASNEDLYRPAGSPIVFSAATSYTNAPETRAEYSGDFFGGPLSSTNPAIERIYWESGDKLRIVHNGTGANYTVTSGTNNSGERKSLATLSSGSLVWDGSGNHTFYGLYPCTGTTVTSTTGGLANDGTVSGTIPATQNINTSNTLSVTEGGVTYSKYRPDTDKYGYMAAYKTISSSDAGSSVELPFRPAFTCFEFKLQRSGSYNPAISSFELKTVAVNGSTTPLTGGFSFQISGGTSDGASWTTPTASSISNPGYSITVGGFPNGSVQVPTSGYLDFSVLALPIDLTGVELIIHYTSGQTKTLKFMNSGVWHQFTGAKKYVITNVNVPDADWEYVIEEIPDQTFIGHTQIDAINYTVKSYKVNKLDNSIKAIVPWRTQYSLNGGASWADVPSNGIISGSDYRINNSAITGSGSYTTGEARSAKLNGSSTATGDPDHSPAAIIAELAGRDAKGTNGAYDLSLHDIYGNTHSRTTANSYIVTAPGTYKFPVVYGNAITNGNDYPEAYWPASTNSAIHSVYDDNKNTNTFRYLYRFKSATDWIGTPYIIDDLNLWNGAVSGMFTLNNPSAAIVWQNCMELYSGETPVPIVQESSVHLSSDNKWIEFTIDPNDIRPGNIIIAFRGGVGTNNSTLPANSILWSWQIWVTANDLTTIEVDNGSFLPYNLGYIDSTPAGAITYPNREIMFRIVQEENNIDHEHEDFTIEQIGDGRSWDASIGFNVYYQWGRKDPMIPAKDYGATTMTPPSPATGTRQVYPDAAFVAGTGYTINVQGLDLAGDWAGNFEADYASGITHPYNAYINTLTTGWVGGSINGYFTAYGTNAGYAWTYDETHRQNSCIPVNLWNNGMFDTMDGTSEKWKTIYDPCPPGFCVPTIGMFSSFTNDSVVGRTTEGAYFATPGGRIFMPYAGLRVYYNRGNGTHYLWAEEVRHSGYYWTDSTFGAIKTTDTEHSFSKHFSFGSTAGTVNAVTPIASHFVSGSLTDYTRGSALAMRPMVDPKYAASSSSPSAAPRGSINSINNGGEIPD